MILIPGSWHLGPFGAGEKKKKKRKIRNSIPHFPTANSCDISSFLGRGENRVIVSSFLSPKEEVTGYGQIKNHENRIRVSHLSLLLKTASTQQNIKPIAKRAYTT